MAGAPISPERRSVITLVAACVPQPVEGRAVLVAVDGVDGAGKSVFADQLAASLTAAGRRTIRASADDFHLPRARRYRRGRRSAVGFWLDSYDYDRLRSDLLDPLSSAGSGRYRVAVHDLDNDCALDLPWRDCPAGAVLVLDGLFLHRDELRHYWDVSVFLEVPFAVTAARMSTRNGTPADPEHPEMARYVGGQRLYFEQCDPASRATVVIDNTDWDRPAVRACR